MNQLHTNLMNRRLYNLHLLLRISRLYAFLYRPYGGNQQAHHFQDNCQARIQSQIILSFQHILLLQIVEQLVAVILIRGQQPLQQVELEN